LGLALIETLFNPEQRLGEAIAKAKKRLLDPSFLDAKRLLLDVAAGVLTADSKVPLSQLRQEQAFLYNLLGDPALRIRVPSRFASFEATLETGVLCVKLETEQPGQGRLAIECSRKEIPHALTPLKEGALNPEVIRENHSRANDKVLYSTELELLRGGNSLSITLPSSLKPGRYWVKARALLGSKFYSDARSVVVSAADGG
jgi:hypothetical protein